MITEQFHLRHVVPMPRWCRGGLCNSKPSSRIFRRTFAGRPASGLTGDEGAALVEFALASMILFTLLIGIFEFSMAFYTYHYVSSAARQGSRYAIVRGFDCQTNLPKAPSTFHCNASGPDIANYVKSLGYPGIDSRKMTVTVSTCRADSTTDADGNAITTWDACEAGTLHNRAGDQVQVKVEYDFPLSIPFWRQTTAPVYSTSNMVYSQ